MYTWRPLASRRWQLSASLPNATTRCHPVCGKITLGLFAMSAARAVQGLVAGVVEAAFAGVDLGLTIRLGASGRMPDCDPLGIGFEPASHSCCLLASSPASALAAGRTAFCFDYRATFSARPSHPIWRAVRRCLS